MPTASMRPGSPDQADGFSMRPAVRWLLIIGGVALAVFLLAWLSGWIRFTTDPRLAEIRKLQADYRDRFMANGGPSTLEEAKEAVAVMGQIREKSEALPLQLRMQAWSGGGGFRSAMQQRINAYFELPPEKRQAELDRQIKQEDLMQKAFEAARAAGGGGPGGGGWPGGGRGPGGGQGGPGGGQAGAGGQAAGPGGRQAGPGSGQGGPGGWQAGRGGPPGGPPRGGSEDERNNWRKRMIDSTSPQQRAQFTEYRRAMDARRDQLGLPPSPWR